MSSEMRELVEDWRSGRLSGYVGLTKTERAVLRVCASELELRLARTEAGADRVDTFAEWLATEMPAGTVIGNPAWWANRIARQYRVRSGVTHPQDASGDAERYRWLRDEASRAQLEMFADRRGTRLAADRVCDAGIDIAMQAKEAK